MQIKMNSQVFSLAGLVPAERKDSWLDDYGEPFLLSGEDGKCFSKTF